ncbi:hypothetical protein AYI70_g7695 [Smittium culicis]|uniref:Uncharacterized protein n=1 Tax=Smittium culicis TaxID=133412 RepID=A0A1R1XJG9_9FUNG|nr:hypothetical protein AYI70_g7695 [Smittium culicis]
MVNFDQEACDTMFCSVIPESATRVAPIARAFGIEVSAGLSMRVDKFLICLVILSTDNGLFKSLVFLNNIFTTIEHF